ncbi:FUSC family protein [Altericroceibacterium endophyticum]|nr:FUSC family protein [Altericroceibacterium endophyticum]
MVIAAAYDQLALGIIASLAGMAFLYLPRTPLHHRMSMMMACSFGMIACFAFGLASQLIPFGKVPVLTVIAILVTMGVRYYRIGPPGSIFFVMPAAIGMYAPFDFENFPAYVGMMALGCIHACIVAFIYSVYILRKRAALPVPPRPVASFDFVWLDSMIIGLFVGLSLAVAELLQLDKPYWVPVSCLAIIQGTSLRAAWTRQIHRITGTIIGLVLAGVLLFFIRDGWVVACAIIMLTFAIELFVVRNYGFAVIFITPLTILLAEAATLGSGNPGPLITARLFDTVLGAVIGFGGAACLHNSVFRERLGALYRKVVPPSLIVET